MYAASDATIQAAIAWVNRSLWRKFQGYADAPALKSAANLGVFRAWREFDPARLKVGDFKTYLHIQGRRRAIEALREDGLIFRPAQVGVVHKRRPLHPPLSLDAPQPESEGRSLTLHGLLGIKDAAVTALDDRDEAAWLVSCLPERLKRVVQLHFFDGLTVKETARLMPRAKGGNGDGITPSQACHLLGEACQRLRRRAERTKITA